jgi:hypothetical protein
MLSLDPSEFLLEPPGLLSRTTPTPSRRPGGLELCEMVDIFLASPQNVPKDILRTLLHQFEKTQLIELILTVAVDSQVAVESIKSLITSTTTFRRLLVRNIPFSASSEAVKSLLARFGVVEEGAVVFDRATGRSKGFAFATFESVTAATAAVAASLNDELALECRPVFLKFAADRDSAESVVTPVASPSHLSVAGGGLAATGGTPIKLFVYNLSPSTTSESLRAAFAVFGEISEAAVVADAQGRSKRFAFVTFVKEEDAWKCMQEPNRCIDGRMTFTHLASEGKRAVGTPRAMRTPRGDAGVQVFTPQGVDTPVGSLLNESLLSQWIAELAMEEGAGAASQQQDFLSF